MPKNETAASLQAVRTILTQVDEALDEVDQLTDEWMKLLRKANKLAIRASAKLDEAKANMHVAAGCFSIIKAKVDDRTERVGTHRRVKAVFKRADFVGGYGWVVASINETLAYAEETKENKTANTSD